VINGLHHVAIATNDADRMLDFYRGLLGLEVLVDYTWTPGTRVADQITALPGSSARHIMLRKGNAYFEIFQYHSPQPAAGDPARRVCDPGIAHFCFDVTDVDGEYERLLAAGMSFHCPPQDAGAGIRTTYGRDPDGNVVELQEVPSSEHRIALPALASARRKRATATGVPDR
jgi:catechol 2,3-dioxygenase-like lactoylglutathione lyase family enzyme